MALKSVLSDSRVYSLIAIAYFAAALFPGTYAPLDVGLDGSWRYAINYLPHSDQIFGRDVAFTYGPLGYFLVPLNIGSNLVQATSFHVLMHVILIIVLVHYALRSKRGLGTIFFVVACALAPAVGEGLTDQYEYSYLTISCVLLVCSYERNRFSLFADVMNPVLAAMFFFMKFSFGLSATLMIAALTIVNMIKRREHAWRTLFLFCGMWLATTLIIVIVCFGSLRSLLSWLTVSWHMADGYSVAMSITGRTRSVVCALIAVAAFAGLMFALRTHRSSLFEVGLVFIIGIFFCFKHAYVRQDGHVLYFFPFVLSLIGILGLNAHTRRELKLAAATFVVVLFLAVPVTRGYHYLNYATVFDKLSGAKGLRNISLFVHLEGTRERLDTQGRFNLLADRLPADWKRLISETGGKVGTLPSEISYCAANNLPCDYFPALQTYNAHTAELDKWCSRHYSSSRAPEFLLISFGDIDQRNPVLSAPATWRAILHNYSWVKSDSQGDVHLFEKKQELGSPTLTITGEQTARLAEWIAVPSSNKPVYASMEMRLAGLGLSSKTLYQVPRVDISLQYESGRYLRYRMIPDTARNGLLMNYVPTDMGSLTRLFAQTANDRVVQFRISGLGTKYYKSEFEIVWKEDATAVQADLEGLKPANPANTSSGEQK